MTTLIGIKTDSDGNIITLDVHAYENVQRGHVEDYTIARICEGCAVNPRPHGHLLHTGQKRYVMKFWEKI